MFGGRRAAKDLMTLNDDDDSIISIVSIDHENLHVMLPLNLFFTFLFLFLILQVNKRSHFSVFIFTKVF